MLGRAAGALVPRARVGKKRGKLRGRRGARRGRQRKRGAVGRLFCRVLPVAVRRLLVVSHADGLMNPLDAEVDFSQNVNVLLSLESSLAGCHSKFAVDLGQDDAVLFTEFQGEAFDDLVVRHLDVDEGVGDDSFDWVLGVGG